MTADIDPSSALMSEAAVCKFLGTDGLGIKALIKQKKLTRDPITGTAFSRAQVLAVHNEIVRNLTGREETTSNYREVPNLR